jgi:hypothetical protein
MKPRHLALLALSVPFVGCAAHPTLRAEATRAAEPHAAVDAAAPSDAATPTAPTPESASVDPRRVGDYVVFNFEGSFHDGPMRLTERVVAADAASITIELALVDHGKKPETLRVRTSTTRDHHGDILGVERASANGSFVAAKTADYEALIQKTLASADANEAVLDSSEDVVTVKDAKIPVTKTRYRVRVGKTAATMSTLASDAFAWGDLGGEIKTDGGALVYRASLVDVGSGEGGVAALETRSTAN